ncbi:MAG TPA: metallophosphoesterase [Bacillota bacterium]|nr:metallophosphoesterase [Bacillota bacterium]
MCDHVFVQLSDTHIEAGDRPYWGIDTAGTFRRTLDAVRALDARPEFFILSGDLCNRGEREGYVRLREVLAELDAFGVPVLLGLGNHDARRPFREVCLGEAETAEEEPYFYARELGGLRVVMLDSKIPGDVAGRLGERQLGWLREALATPAPDGTVVVVHHPPFLNAVHHMDGHGLADAEALADILREHPVLGLLHGHTHIVSCAAWAGTLSVTAPGVAHMLAPATREGLDFVEGSGFNLCVVRDGRLTVQPVMLPGAQTLLFRWDGRRESIAAAHG